MLIELVSFELRKAAYAFGFFADGFVLFVFGKDCLSIFAGMFLDESFESHWLIPLVLLESIGFLSSIPCCRFVCYTRECWGIGDKIPNGKGSYAQSVIECTYMV